MRAFPPVVTLLLPALLGLTGPVFAASVDLSWDQCVTGSNVPIVDRTKTTPGVQTIALTGNGLAGRVIGTHFVFELRSPAGLPAAWRFDAGGCNEGNLQFLTTTTTKACPTIGGLPSASVQYVIDPGGQAATLTIDVLYGGPAELFANSTYSLGRIALDFSSPDCAGLDQPVCIALVEAGIVPWGGGTTEPLDRGQSFVRWNDAGNQTACSGGTLRGFRVEEFTVTCASYDLESYFLELAPPAGGTTLAGPIAVRTESATGAVLLDEIVTPPERIGQPWGAGSSWLIGTDRFADASQLLRDHEAEGFLDRNGGRIVVRDARPGGPVLQVLRYGPGEAIPVPGAGRSIVEAPGGYVVSQTPAPRNFAGATATVLCHPITENRFLVREFSPACFSSSTAGQFVEIESLSDSLWSGQLILDVLDGNGSVLATRAGLFGTGASSSRPGIGTWLVATSQFQGAAGFSPDALWSGFASSQARLFRLRSPSFGVLFEAPVGAPGAAPIPEPGHSVRFELDGSFAIAFPPTPRNSQGATPGASECFPADTSWVARTSGIRVAEIATACQATDPRVRFFELRADRVDQELNRRLKIEVFGQTGNLIFSSSNLFAPLPDGTPWPEGRSWLFASAEAAATFGVAPDAPCPTLNLAGGRIRISDERMPARVIDDFRYGTGPIMAPPPGSSIQRAVDGTVTLVSPPEPNNFAGATSSGIVCPPSPFAGVRIAEVSTRCQFGDARVRFIELVATGDAQFQPGLTLTVYNASGSVMGGINDLLAPQPDGTPWPAGRAWLLGSQELAAAYGVSPDGACPVLDPLGGRIRLHDAAVPAITIDELVYGPGGSIAAPPPAQSIRRLPLGSYEISPSPEPMNYAGQSGSLLECPCPLATYSWGFTGAKTTNAASYDSTSGSLRLAFDRRNPSITIDLRWWSGAVTLGDRFVLLGGAPGQEVDVFALFRVYGHSFGPCFPVHGCAGGAGWVNWSMEDTSGVLGPWANVNQQFAIPLRLRVGEPFAFYWSLTTITDSNGSAVGEAYFSSTFEWANLPAGMHVESCAGYFDDTPVATLPSLVSTSADAGVVRLEWSPLAKDVNGLAVERRNEDRDWAMIGTPDADRSRIVFADRAAAAGTRYAYRLSWSDAAGAHTTEEAWVMVPAPSLAFAARLSSGPVVRGPIAFGLQLPTTEEVGVELFDLKGRRLDEVRWQPAAPGASTFEFRPARTLAPGVYWIRLRQGAVQSTLRAIVLDGR